MRHCPVCVFPTVQKYMVFLNSEESHCQDACILKMTMVFTRQQAACSENMPVLLVPNER